MKAVNLGRSLRSVDVWLVLAAALGAALRLTRLGDFDNPYYTATVASMLHSPGNFLFASFDPGGAVMVDKPPVSFWVQAIPAAIFGVSRWSVTVPQAIAGILAIILLYMAIKPAFGRIAALAAATTLAVIPASVVIDSRNEPDSLLSFTLLLAAFSVVRAVQTGKWRWLIAFALLMAIGFNTKMLVAFVPLPAFLLYYVLAARGPARRVAIRASAVITVLLLVSFSWVTVVALTPAEHRPYIGSTRDNSIWTLVFEYNGLDRFGSFIGLRPRQPLPTQQGGPYLQQGQPLAPPGYPTPQAGAQSMRPPAITPDVPEVGLSGLFTNPLAGQLGWLLPMGLLALAVILVPLLPESVYRHPTALLSLLKESPAASQSVLWGGWFATAVVVFGLARATTTHPYYLVGVAVPLAAVMGIGLSLLWNTFKQGGAMSWLLAIALAGGAFYQVYGSRDQVGEWAIATVLAVLLAATLVMAVAIYRKLTPLPLATASVVAGALSILLIPSVIAATAGGRIAGPAAGQPQQAPAPPANQEQPRVGAVSSFIERQDSADSLFRLGTVSAREAAPFIIAGVPALAIGGFSGNDPIFTADAFRALAGRGDLPYFLMPGGPTPAGPAGRQPQEQILRYIRLTWEDVSLAAGLPSGSLYRYRDPALRP